MTKRQREILAEIIKNLEGSLMRDAKSATHSLIDMFVAKTSARRVEADNCVHYLTEAIHVVQNLVELAASASVKLQEARFSLPPADDDDDDDDDDQS